MNKSLSTKILSLIAGVYLAITIPLVLYLNHKLETSFEQIEDAAAEKSMAQSISYIQNRIETLTAKGADWAKWDDAHQFLIDGNIEFLHGNLRNEAHVFGVFKTDLLVLRDAHGKDLYAQSLDRTQSIPSNDKVFFKSIYDDNNPIEDIVQFGFDDRRQQFFTLIQQHVTNSDETEPPSGCLILAFYLDDAFLEEVSQSTRHAIQIKKNVDKKHIERASQNRLIISENFTYNDKPAPFAIQAILKRPHYTIFQTSLRLVLLVLGISFLIFAIVIYVYVHKDLINRLQDIMQWLNQYSESKGFSPLHVYGQDEISQVMKSINAMGQSLQEHHQELITQQRHIATNARMASLGEMAGGIAHEINNPLAIIQGRSLQLISRLDKDKFDANFFRQSLDTIVKTCERISKIVIGLRVFSREDNRDDFTSVSIAKLITDTSSFCEESLRSEHIELRIQPVSDISVNGSYIQLSQVLVNLLNNAKDAIRHLDIKWIELSANKMNPMKVQIRVRDSGKGIPKDIADKLMQPFFTTKDIGQGTGLGLSISKGILENHSGRLFVDDLDEHTSFIIELPIS